MLKRELIASQVSESLQFLDDRWDAALLGYAESGGPGPHILPCYGHQAMKVLLRDKGATPKEIFIQLNMLTNSMGEDAPLVLIKYNRPALWKLIREKGFPHWDLLERAIIGIGRIGWTERGVVYNRPLCANILQSSHSATLQGSMADAVLASTQLDSSIVPTSIGENSPWFVTPV